MNDQSIGYYYDRSFDSRQNQERTDICFKNFCISIYICLGCFVNAYLLHQVISIQEGQNERRIQYGKNTCKFGLYYSLIIYYSFAMVAISRGIYAVIVMFFGSFRKANRVLSVFEIKMRSAEIMMACFFLVSLTFILVVSEPCHDLFAYLLILICFTGIMMVNFCLDDIEDDFLCDEGFYSLI